MLYKPVKKELLIQTIPKTRQLAGLQNHQQQRPLKKQIFFLYSVNSQLSVTKQRSNKI